MNPTPPQNSNISISSRGSSQIVSIPHGSAGVMRFFIGAFLLVWLGGWTMGFLSAGKEVLSGDAEAFLIFWLAGWCLGGAFAVFFLYRIFRPSVPEQLILNKPCLSLDTGIPPFKMVFGWVNQTEYWKSMFPKREKMEFTSAEMNSLKLRETDAGNRLTIDQGAHRIELAKSSTEIEREWLYDFLKDHYS
ncbi:hypothetical protein [Pontiella sp.]|uniref:hypothetical protein n=1 Tax=Pontiella sp. TaxID=2837462 RepID=UPI003568A83A